MPQPQDSAGSLHQDFLVRLAIEVEANVHEETYSVEALAENMGMSRSQIHRKLKAGTGKNITQYIREVRLKRGLELLQHPEISVAEVAYQVGFSSPSYFSKCFSQQYGFPPGESIEKGAKLLSSHEHSSLPKEPLDIARSNSRQPIVKLSILFGIIAVLGAGVTYYLSGGLPEPSRKISPDNMAPIAVLPFSNLTEDPSEIYLVEGVHESIISELNHAQIKVVPRTTMVSYQDRSKRVAQISEELGTPYLIEGAVYRKGNVLSLEIRLVDGEKESYLWSKTFETQIKDVFSLYKQATKSIAEEIQIVLAPEVLAQLEEKQVVHPQAYELYLKGRYHANIGGLEDTRRATEYYQRATALAPELGMAYTGLVETYLYLGFGQLDPFEAHTGFRINAQKALELDPSIASNHHLLATINIFSEWDWQGAEEELKKAIAANPHSSAAYDSYCQFLWAMGRMEESVAAGKQAVKTDPKDHFAHCDLGWAHFYAGDLLAARQQTQATIDSFGLDCTFHYLLSYRLRMQGASEETLQLIVKELQTNLQEEIHDPWLEKAILAQVYARLGNTAEARSLLSDISAQEKQQFIDPFFFAPTYLALGDKEQTYYYLEKGALQRSFLLLYTLKIDPWFDPIREEERFQTLLRSMKL